MQERQMAVRAIGEIYFIHGVTLLNALTLIVVRVGVNRPSNRKNPVVKEVSRLAGILREGRKAKNQMNKA
jgi:hypothetical protein